MVDHFVVPPGRARLFGPCLARRTMLSRSSLACSNSLWACRHSLDQQHPRARVATGQYIDQCPAVVHIGCSDLGLADRLVPCIGVGVRLVEIEALVVLLQLQADFVKNSASGQVALDQALYEVPQRVCVRHVQRTVQSTKCWKLIRSSIWHTLASQQGLYSAWMNSRRTMTSVGYGVSPPVLRSARGHAASTWAATALNQSVHRLSPDWR